MSDLNQCNFIGRLGRDPEIKYLPSGNAVANFSIAVSESWKNKATGEKEGKTTWVNLTAFNKLAEVIGQYLKKGSKVFVSGRFGTREWEKDGVKKYSYEFTVSEMQMLDSKPQVGAAHGQQESVAAQDFDDELPF